MLSEAITATKKYINGFEKRYMGHLNMMYNGDLSIARFVFLTTKI